MTMFVTRFLPSMATAGAEIGAIQKIFSILKSRYTDNGDSIERFLDLHV